MQCACVVATRAEGLGQIVHLAAGPGEDERRGRILDVEDAAQGWQLVRAPDHVGDLPDARHAIAGGLLCVDLDPRRILQVAFGDTRDRRRDRRREERRLASGRCGRQDRLEVFGEAHVEHLVGLVEDRDHHLVETQAAALQVIDRSARRRDDDVNASPQPAELLPDRLPAIDRQDARPHLAAIFQERFGHLHRELAGGDQHECRGAAFAGPPDGDPLECRQREGGRLAGAGRCLRQQVAAGQERRDGLALDGGRLLVTERRDRAQQTRVELERGEAIDDGLGAIAIDDGCLVGIELSHALHPRPDEGAQRAPAIGSRSIARTRRVPPPSVRTVAAGMTPATSRSIVASSPAYRPAPAMRTRAPTLRFLRPAPAVTSIETRFGRTIATSGPAPARGAPFVWVRATG